MRFSIILLTAILQMSSSFVFAAESIEIVVPKDGGTVNTNGFTLVAQAQGDFDVYQYMVLISLFNDWNGEIQQASVYPTGTSYSIGAARMEIISPKPSDLDDTNPKAVNSKLPIVVQVRNLIEADNYWLGVSLFRWPDDTYITGDGVSVQRK
jgi:hypothetical protein